LSVSSLLQCTLSISKANGSKVCLIDNDGFICRTIYNIKIKSWKIKEDQTNYRSYSRERAFVYTVGQERISPINGKYEKEIFFKLKK
jgi:hypothetical protein